LVESISQAISMTYNFQKGQLTGILTGQNTPNASPCKTKTLSQDEKNIVLQILSEPPETKQIPNGTRTKPELSIAEIVVLWEALLPRTRAAIVALCRADSAYCGATDEK